MNILIEIDRQLSLLEKEYEEVVKRLQREKHIPDYTMRVTSGHGKHDYYYRDENHSLVYIPVAKRLFAKEMIQKDYDKKALMKIQEQKRLLEKFRKQYQENPVEAVYEKCCKGRQEFIEPLIENRDVFRKNWLDEHQGNKNTFEEKGIYLTNKGEYVRSKSEKILADMFYKYGIPYQYEPEFSLYNGRKCYPDFVLLNERERKTIYWEHFGLTSSKEYAENNLDKLAKYEKSGLILGDNLIVSFESSGVTLDVKLVEEKIRNNLL